MGLQAVHVQVLCLDLAMRAPILVVRSVEWGAGTLEVKWEVAAMECVSTVLLVKERVEYQVVTAKGKKTLRVNDDDV